MKAIQMLAARSATAATRATALRTTCRFSTVTRNITRTAALPLRTNYRSFSTSRVTALGLSPTHEDPEPPNTEDHGSGIQAADLTESEYHEISDQYMNSLLLTLEELADGDKGGSDVVEVEYSAGVLTVGHPKKGTYVLNKQPPNKQIWLSSPVSGPKRFDWTIPRTGGGMDSKQDQEDSHGEVGDNGILGGGKWTYLRDGTTLSSILKEELGVVVAKEEDPDATVGREGPGAGGVAGPVEG